MHTKLKKRVLNTAFSNCRHAHSGDKITVDVLSIRQEKVNITDVQKYKHEQKQIGC